MVTGMAGRNVFYCALQQSLHFYIVRRVKYKAGMTDRGVIMRDDVMCVNMQHYIPFSLLYSEGAI